ncbi:hypothetical protein BGW80DRAFT_228208 [Lactifluus volemus]|nr:hypothetical protein BGW80DRAFT_228208 [Lactifluus volemus]
MTPSELVLFGYVGKVMHTFAGLYIWQYITTLDFEWEVYTKVRPWRWSFIAYFLARVLSLFAMILSLVDFNITREHNCQAWSRTLLAFGWLGGVSSSFIIFLRAVAIWGRDIRVIASTGTLWLAHLGAALTAITKSHNRWDPSLHGCAVTRTTDFRWSLLIKFVADLIMLGIMILGVLHKRNATYLWNMLYFQGLFWILTAIMTDLPNVVLSFKNINDAWNVMFQYPQCRSRSNFH